MFCVELCAYKRKYMDCSVHCSVLTAIEPLITTGFVSTSLFRGVKELDGHSFFYFAKKSMAIDVIQQKPNSKILSAADHRN